MKSSALNKSLLLLLLIVLAGCDSGSDNNIRIEIELKSLPTTVSYGYADPIPGSIINENHWRIYFDLNNDLVINPGDIFFSIETLRHDDTLLTTISIEDMSARYYELTESSPLGRSFDTIDYSVEDNSFIISVSKALYSHLGNISNGTQIYLSTEYIDIDTLTIYQDYYPAKDTYTSGLDTASLNDALNDFETNLGPVSGFDFPHIDILNIRVVP